MTRFRIGDRVIKNPATWRPSEFDGWGAGVGIGIIVEPPWDHDDGLFDVGTEHEAVDVRWPGGRAFARVVELLPAPGPPKGDES